MISDEQLVQVINLMRGPEWDGVREIALHTLALHLGIRRLAEFVPYDSQLRQDMLTLIGEEMVDTPPKTTDEKVAFRKDWDRRVEEGK